MNKKINLVHCVCTFMIILELLWMQQKVFFEGFGSIFKVIYYMKYFCSFFFIIFTFMKNKNFLSSNKTNNLIKMFLPFIFIIIVNEIISIPNNQIIDYFGTSYYSRFLALFLDKLCIFINVICITQLCKKETVKVFSHAFIINGIAIILVSILKTGFVNTIMVFGQLFTFSSNSSIMEVHELTFATGLLLLYYIFFYKNKNKKDWTNIVLLFVVFFSGYKRIATFAFILCLFVYLLSKKIISYKTIMLAGTLSVFLLFIYIGLIYDRTFFEHLKLYGIDVMGRDSIVEYFIKRTNFSLFERGTGFAGVSKMFELRTKAEVGNNIAVQGLHNDILKIYICFGFFGSILVFGYWCLFVPRYIYIRNGLRTMFCYFLLTIYSLITYLTDNTENYFVFQVVLYSLPASLTYFANDKRCRL